MSITCTGPFSHSADGQTPEARTNLQTFVDALEANQGRDLKGTMVLDILLHQEWLDEGCITFSQYFDSIWWLAHHLSHEMPQETLGIYVGGQRSGVMTAGVITSKPREELKHIVRRGELRVAARDRCRQ